MASNWGYGPEQTATRLYGADPTLFNGGPPMIARLKGFVFVGQFIDRKNVLGLAEAFVDTADQIPEWTLNLCGSGPQADQLPTHPRLLVRGFLQPPELAQILRNARCLVLPSREEHWGLVVHEAALSGCALALSTAVGAADDLARPENAVLFPPGDRRAIAQALVELASWDTARWTAAEETSRRLALGFGPDPFADSVTALVEKLSAGQAA
jgi:glycosyltransferase involved in cell wall biosynthesis